MTLSVLETSATIKPSIEPYLRTHPLRRTLDWKLLVGPKLTGKHTAATRSSVTNFIVLSYLPPSAEGYTGFLDPPCKEGLIDTYPRVYPYILHLVAFGNTLLIAEETCVDTYLEPYHPHRRHRLPHRRPLWLYTLHLVIFGNTLTFSEQTCVDTYLEPYHRHRRHRLPRCRPQCLTTAVAPQSRSPTVQPLHPRRQGGFAAQPTMRDRPPCTRSRWRLPAIEPAPLRTSPLPATDALPPTWETASLWGHAPSSRPSRTTSSP